ncbi:MAG: ATP-binding protein [Planctomycetota bacterium]
MGSWRSWIIPIGAAAVGLTLAIIVRNLLVVEEEEVLRARFTADATGVVNSIQGELDVVSEKLIALRAFFVGSVEVDGDEFSKFTGLLMHDHAELEGFLWAEEVVEKKGEKAKLTFKFAEPPDLVPEEFDLESDPMRRAALRRTNSDGGAAATFPTDGSLYLICRAASKKQPGFIALRLNINEIVKRADLRIPGRALDVTIFDHSGAERVAIVGEEGAGGYDHPAPLRFGQRDLQVSVRPRRGSSLAARSAAPVAVFWAIIAATVVALAYVWSLQTHTARSEQLVKDRTARIREVTRLQRAILESAEYAIIAFDPDGRILTFNPAAERMLRYREEEVVGRMTPLEFLEEGQLRDLSQEFQVDADLHVLLRQAGVGVVGPWRFRRSDGTTLPASISVSALRDEANVITGFLAIARDITAQLEVEEQLRHATAEAETASQTKSQFLANMSHELRTPLTAILGYSEMLEEDAQQAGSLDAARDLKRIQDAGRHLLRLIDDVLDLSKVEAGRIALNPENVDVPSLVEDVATTVRPLAERKGNTLAIRCDRGSLEADPTRLKQVLFNLVANAARFTENGKIVLEADCEPDAVTFRVRDTGIGMSTEELARVFEPFVQADATTTRKFGGTGLGLAIAREFTQLMGGSLEAQSEPGEGSEFRLRVPARQS